MWVNPAFPSCTYPDGALESVTHSGNSCLSCLVSTLGWDPGAQWEAALAKACPGNLTSGGAGMRTQVSASLSCSPHCFPVSREKFPEHLLWSNSSSDAYRGLPSVWCGAHWQTLVGSLISLCGINSPIKETEAEKMLHRNREQSQGLNSSAPGSRAGISAHAFISYPALGHS